MVGWIENQSMLGDTRPSLVVIDEIDGAMGGGDGRSAIHVSSDTGYLFLDFLDTVYELSFFLFWILLVRRGFVCSISSAGSREAHQRDAEETESSSREIQTDIGRKNG